MMTRVIDRASIPGRHHEPQLSVQLTNIEQVGVATPHGTVAAWRVGTGPAVLLVHGWRDSARLWDPLMAQLQRAGGPSLSWTYPGTGSPKGSAASPRRSPTPCWR